MRSVPKWYCAMRERCVRYDPQTGRSQELSRYNTDDVCYGCREAGYRPEDLPTASSDQPLAQRCPDREIEACAKCGEPAVSGYGDIYFCEKHWNQIHSDGVTAVFPHVDDEPITPPEEQFEELFHAARTLFRYGVTEELKTIPTLVFAEQAPTACCDEDGPHGNMDG
jgi:hypothetical protein